MVVIVLGKYIRCTRGICDLNVGSYFMEVVMPRVTFEAPLNTFKHSKQSMQYLDNIEHCPSIAVSRSAVLLCEVEKRASGQAKYGIDVGLNFRDKSNRFLCRRFERLNCHFNLVMCSAY